MTIKTTTPVPRHVFRAPGGNTGAPSEAQAAPVGRCTPLALATTPGVAIARTASPVQCSICPPRSQGHRHGSRPVPTPAGSVLGRRLRRDRQLVCFEGAPLVLALVVACGEMWHWCGACRECTGRRSPSAGVKNGDRGAWATGPPPKKQNPLPSQTGTPWANPPHSHAPLSRSMRVPPIPKYTRGL